ncbi:MAG: hydrogenase maturation protease [Proteobacteria bacterium]|nr:hydrogenase maturation protease [Pseudomonadota bacterium]
MIKVVGVGNPLLGDDGFGLEVLNLLENEKIEGVEFIKLPTPSPWLLYEVFREGDYFIVVDALYDGELGKIETFPLSKLKAYQSNLKSLHEVSLAQVFDLLSLYDIDVNGIVVGTRVKDTTPKIGLSEELSNLVSQTAKRVIEILKEL